MKFNYIQSFIIKKDAVNGAQHTFLTSIDLYFKNKPTATGNKSGVERPGVSIYVCPFKEDMPFFDDALQNEFAYAEWGTISTLADASVPTNFKFNTPVTIEPEKYYGIVIKFEDNDYQLWTAVQNETILNTTKIYSGTGGEGDGKLYAAASDTDIKPLSDRDLKFNIKIAKFTANTAALEFTHDDHEFFTVAQMSNVPKFIGGEQVFQNFGLVANATANTIYSRVGTVTSQSGNTILIGTGTTFTSNYSALNHIILTNTSNSAQYHLARIDSVVSDTQIVLDTPMPFGNTSYHAPVVTGKVLARDHVLRTVKLYDSTASNSSIRFYSNAVKYFTITTPGGSYSNNDTVRVSNGSINATGTLITNATGNVVSIRLLTPGSDFPNASHSVVTITTSTGSGAALAPVIGAPLKGVISGATAEITSIDDQLVHIINPKIDIKQTSTSSAALSFALANSSNYIQPFTVSDQITPLDVTKYNGRVLSRSRELTNTTNLFNTDKSFAMKIDLGINVANVTNTPVYYAPFLLEDEIVVFTFYNLLDPVNTDISVEFGRCAALSKHISKKIAFANNLFAEDIRVYIEAYKPANTDLLVYAKVHNSTDPEPYDDKSWTPLELKDGINKISAIDNKADVKEYTYGFPQYPASEFTFPGTGTSTLSSAIITTTNDLSANLAANDLIKVYNPLFSTTNYLVTSVGSVNSTAVVVTTIVSNNGLVSSGLKIDKLRFKNVAYNNVLNDNVARYYNTTMVPYDTYDSVAIKIVLLSDDDNISPEVDSLRVIGVSA